MKKPNNTIEINGRLYDAHNGQPLDESAKHPAVKKVISKKSQPTTQKKYIDGFQHRPGNTHKKTQATKTMPSEVRQTAIPKTSQRTHHAAQRVVSRPKKSTTLHRRAVKAPQIHVSSTSTAIPTNPAIKEPSKPVIAAAKIVPKKDQAREKRARTIQKSAVIQHFHSSSLVDSTVAPKPAEVSSQSPQNAAEKKPLSEYLTKTHHATVSPGPKKTTDIEAHVVKRAAASIAQKRQKVKQQKAAAKKKRVKLTGYTSSALVTLLLLGYIAYLNIPTISLKIAGNSAGFAATMPHVPSGFSLNGPIAHNPGQVIINFKSNTDERRFSLNQQPTSWDSTALLENYVAKEAKEYATYQDRGLTIYTLDNESAAWVNAGKFYTLDLQNSQLDTRKLLDIATSM